MAEYSGPFIAQIEADEAQGELKQVYDDIIAWTGGRLPPVLKLAGAHPTALGALKSLNTAVTFGGSTLGRRKEEMIATAISVWNDCPY